MQIVVNLFCHNCVLPISQQLQHDSDVL